MNYYTIKNLPSEFQMPIFNMRDLERELSPEGGIRPTIPTIPSIGELPPTWKDYNPNKKPDDNKKPPSDCPGSQPLIDSDRKPIIWN